MNSSNKNNIKRTKEWNGDDNRWVPANEIADCALAPPTTEKPAVLKSWRIPNERFLKNSKGTLFWQENTTKKIIYM